MRTMICLTLACALSLPASAHAQSSADASATRAADAIPARAELFRAAPEEAARTDGRAHGLSLPGRGTTTIAKWSSLTLSVASAGVGVVTHARAENRFEMLEQMCRAEPDRCEPRLSNGSYVDPDLERRYQEVVKLDRRARSALLVSQVGVAATVVLFLLDLRGDSEPETVPYDPRTLRVEPLPDGRLSLGVSLPAGGREPR